MPNHSRKRRAARAKARKNTNPVNAPLEECANMSSNAMNDATAEEQQEFKSLLPQDNKPDLKATESASGKSIEEKDSKVEKKLINNEEKLSDEAILKKIDTDLKASGEAAEPCVQEGANISSNLMNNATSEKRQKNTPDLKATENASGKSNKGKGKDSKAEKEFIFNEEKLSDEAILEKIDKDLKASGGAAEPGCILKISYPNGPDKKPTQTVLTPEDITPEKSGGVLKIIIKDGQVNEYPGVGDQVLIDYEAFILKANEQVLFESTKDHEVKKEFSLGRGEMIKGCDLAISTMKRGEKASILIRPQYGFGFISTLKVPANSTLLYNIELLDWKLEDLSPEKDGGILRKILEKGDDSTFPNEGFKVKVKLWGYHNGKIFEDCVKEFILGEGCCHDIPEGIEMALYKFQLQEKSTIYLRDKYGFEKGNEKFDIPPMAPITYEVKLLSFKKEKEIWEMNTDEKYEKALESKERGVVLVKINNYELALKHFKWIITCLEKEPGVDPESVESRNSLLLAGYLNTALCHLKLGNYRDAIKFCDKALTMNPQHEKALYRRGQAKMKINDCEDALKDFGTLLSLYPKNKAASSLTTECQSIIKAQQLKDKSTFSKMFDKFVKQDQDRMKNMKTETGVWQDENEEREAPRPMTEAERLIEQNNSLLRDANIIELSNNVGDKF